MKNMKFLPLMLLNYKQLRSNLEYKDCIGKVMIVCYTIQDTNISIFGNLGSLEFLKNNNAQGYNGEIFIEENIIYCAVGQLNNDEFQEKDSWEIQRSMGAVWKKISQYYNKYEVEFNRRFLYALTSNLFLEFNNNCNFNRDEYKKIIKENCVLEASKYYSSINNVSKYLWRLISKGRYDSSYYFFRVTNKMYLIKKRLNQIM